MYVRTIYLMTQCPECHAETQTHPLAKTTELAFLCKKCRRAFRKDMAVYEQADEYCPHCDNHYVRCLRVLHIQVIEAKTPQLMLSVEGDDGRVDPSIIRDDRISSKGVESSHVNKIDEGGYQAAAIEFQRQLAQGRRNGAELSSSSRTSDIPSMTDFRDDELDWD